MNKGLSTIMVVKPFKLEQTAFQMKYLRNRFRRCTLPDVPKVVKHVNEQDVYVALLYFSKK